MLLRFRVRNYASLRDEQELSLVAAESPGLHEGDSHVVDATALPVAAIYGSNASGKSNIIKAFNFGLETIRDSHQRWLPDEPIPRWPFRLDGHSANEPSTFVFEFVVEGVRYEYGFALNDRLILEEWLYTWPRGKRQRLFTRRKSELEFGRQLGGNKAAIRELVRSNSLFLSAAAANNHDLLGRISQFFGSGQMRVHERVEHQRARERRFNRVALHATQDAQLMDLIRYADLGIVGTVEHTPRADVDELGELLEQELGGSAQMLSDDKVMARVLEQVHATRRATVTWLHEAGPEAGAVSLPAVWESYGTVEWMFLVSNALAMLRVGGTLLVDDLGGDLHPTLVAQLVKLFLERETNPRGAQLIFNTHDVTLLWRGSEARLHRDQVWFTTKSRDGATTLYPLTDFRARDGVDDFMGRYLHGRYEAIPFFEERLLDALRHDLQA